MIESNFNPNLVAPVFHRVAQKLNDYVLFEIENPKHRMKLDKIDERVKTQKTKPIIPAKPGFTSPPPLPFSPSKLNRKDVRLITQDFHLFFLPVKVKSAKCQSFFLYNFPFIGIYKANSTQPELVVFPKESIVYIEGRILNIGSKPNENKYQIQIEKNKIDAILNITQPTPLGCYSCCKAIVNKLEPCYLLNHFYSNGIYNTHFLMTLTKLRFPDSLKDDFIDTWVIAAEYIFEPIFSFIFETYFAGKTKPEKCFRAGSFIVNIGTAIFRKDDDFFDFMDHISKTKNLTVETFLKDFSKLSFSQYTKLFMHIIYRSAMKVYRRPKKAFYLMRSYLYKSVVHPNIQEQSNKTIAEFEKLHNFSHAGVYIGVLAQYEKILAQFQAFPVDFEPTVFDDTNYEAFVKLEQTVIIGGEVFLKAINKSTPIPAEDPNMKHETSDESSAMTESS